MSQCGQSTPDGNGLAYCTREKGHPGLCKTYDGVEWYPTRDEDPVVLDRRVRGLEQTLGRLREILERYDP